MYKANKGVVVVVVVDTDSKSSMTSSNSVLQSKSDISIARAQQNTRDNLARGN